MRLEIHLINKNNITLIEQIVKANFKDNHYFNLHYLL